MHAEHQPGEDGSPLDLFWAVPLDEPPAPPQLVAGETPGILRPDIPLLSLFRTADTLPEAGFHPRLRRFDEAA